MCYNLDCFSLALFSQYYHKLDLPATSGCQCKGNSLPYAQTTSEVGHDVAIYNKKQERREAYFENKEKREKNKDI